MSSGNQFITQNWRKLVDKVFAVYLRTHRQTLKRYFCAEGLTSPVSDRKARKKCRRILVSMFQVMSLSMLSRSMRRKQGGFVLKRCRFSSNKRYPKIPTSEKVELMAFIISRKATITSKSGTSFDDYMVYIRRGCAINRLCLIPQSCSATMASMLIGDKVVKKFGIGHAAPEATPSPWPIQKANSTSWTSLEVFRGVHARCVFKNCYA